MGTGISSAWTVRRRILDQSQGQDPFLRVSIASMGLSHVPVISSFCPMVTNLDISNNMISALPEHLQRFQHLSTLDVSTNQLATLPCYLGSFVSLTDLRASDNNIIQLPESLVLPSLTSLSMCRNYLEHGLPATLCQSMSSLKILLLSNNGIGPAAASSTIILLTALVELNLSVNNLGAETLLTLPRVSLGEILEEAYCLDQLPPPGTPGPSLDHEGPRQLSFGNQTKKRLDEITHVANTGCNGFEEIFQMRVKFARLDLSGNNFQQLPPQMNICRFLRVLCAHQNCLGMLPDMSDCVYIQEVLLSFNKFKSVPLGSLHHGSLKLLDMRGNKIFQPPTLEELKGVPSNCVVLIDAE